jgi:hypothetical protein
MHSRHLKLSVIRRLIPSSLFDITQTASDDRIKVFRSLLEHVSKHDVQDHDDHEWTEYVTHLAPSGRSDAVLRSRAVALPRHSTRIRSCNRVLGLR